MHSFDDYYYFYLVVKHGGFSAASEAENITKSKLSRRILELEDKFNVNLIQRTTRHFKVTALGQEFYEECAKVIAQVECAKNVLLQQRTEPQGLVKISCPLLMMRFQIRELINHFLKAYPKVEIELELTSRRVDVLYDDIDIAIRTNFEMTEDSSLIVRDVIKTTHCLVAAPEVLQGQHIESHQQLTDFPCIGLGNQKQDYGWILRNYENNQKVNINFNPRMRCNDLAGVYYAACDGLGIADLPYLTVEEDIKQGKLIHILPEWESNEGMVQLVYASRKGQRLVVEKLIETLVGGMRSLGNMKKGYRLI
ncbi:LysR family transcriptional regulator [Acinetobacter ursingii]|uniref:LysR substrate-binding domain-containing protein n=2 Tax=Acinetobacter ursingii TaxID=108980 RepID=UPI00124E4CDA|nr:LysR substrate-binding domain-containing protein [Acinetobacter ursingii]MCU4306272.1 LysR family transcriptional regulator [Acinetobacter ursingii]MCU4371813.1 LysR family transcriptional regulator [Acinetobacter ursingii]MCU4382723.1 LysR family transcriptional regulator [Acinetobacter ursingii]MDG9992947.1 LysR substrate-binding domain-containing protein [Acinetobacter ursingii]MDH0203800.1 LysR substrate-binding domain-containing protein [Acinetobacter ursingii]